MGNVDLTRPNLSFSLVIANFALKQSFKKSTNYYDFYSIHDEDFTPVYSNSKLM